VRATWARDRKEGTADHRSGDRRFDSSSSGWGLHLLSWVGAAPPPTEVAQPDPLCRGGCGFRATTRLLLSASFTHPPHQLASSTPPSGLGTPCLGPSPLATWRSGDLLLSPSAPPMRCPGAVTPSGRLARGPVRPRPASSPEERICAGVTARLRCLRSEDRLAARLPSIPTARPRRTTFHPYKDAEEPEPCLSAGARKWGVWGWGRGERDGRWWSSVLRWAPRTGRWTFSFRSHVSGMPARLTRRCSRSAVGRHAGCERGRAGRSPPRAESPPASRAKPRRGSVGGKRHPGRLQ
jgi:hypothetical protein